MKYTFNAEDHIHMLDEKPLIGTSSVSNILAKPLHWWALGVGLAHLGWTPVNDKKTKKKVPTEIRLEAVKKWLGDEANRKLFETPEEWLTRLDKCYYAHDKEKNKAAGKGVDLHAVLEDYVKKCLAENEGRPLPSDDTLIKPFVDWALTRVKRFLWSEMYCYSTELWTGGISDCGFEDVDGKYGIMDFKSSKEAYLSQFWQIAGYDIEISENGGFDKDGNKVFELDKPISQYCVLPFGMEVPEVVYSYNIEEGREAFKAEVTLYKLMNQTVIS